LVDSLSTPAFT